MRICRKGRRLRDPSADPPPCLAAGSPGRDREERFSPSVTRPIVPCHRSLRSAGGRRPSQRPVAAVPAGTPNPGHWRTAGLSSRYCPGQSPSLPGLGLCPVYSLWVCGDLLNKNMRDIGLWAMADLATPMAIRVVATLRIADHITRGLQTSSELAEAAGVGATASRCAPRWTWRCSCALG